MRTALWGRSLALGPASCGRASKIALALDPKAVLYRRLHAPNNDDDDTSLNGVLDLPLARFAGIELPPCIM